MSERSRLRYPALLVGLLSLALGLWAGLARIGWSLPLPTSALAEAHGALMINGVLATLIGLERAVALERRIFFAGPLLTGVGSIALASGVPFLPGIPLLVAGSLVVLAMFLVILYRQPALHTVVQALGAGALLAGNVLWWQGLDIPYLIPWWGSFLVLVISAERLELTRVLPIVPWRRHLFAGLVALDLVGCGIALAWFEIGAMVLAVSWTGMALWLLVHDVARRNLRRTGLPRFTASCLLTGYGWLAAGGVLILAFGGIVPDGLVYDAELHAVFLGFVLSMIFAHAPIILPAVMGKPLPFQRSFYAPVVILHASLLARVLADLDNLQTLRAWSGLFNVVAIVSFGIALVVAVALNSSLLKRALAVDSSIFYP